MMVDRNNIGPEGARALAQAIIDKNKLTELYIRYL